MHENKTWIRRKIETKGKNSKRFHFQPSKIKLVFVLISICRHHFEWLGIGQCGYTFDQCNRHRPRKRYKIVPSCIWSWNSIFLNLILGKRFLEKWWYSSRTAERSSIFEATVQIDIKRSNQIDVKFKYSSWNRNRKRNYSWKPDIPTIQITWRTRNWFYFLWFLIGY